MYIRNDVIAATRKSRVCHLARVTWAPRSPTGPSDGAAALSVSGTSPDGRCREDKSILELNVQNLGFEFEGYF